ncbi:hypothetical protein CBR_g3521 [Chara braunii]|uniref:Uncharacterized protein n=1 Tax=Chara braunii TaxID=69332 RepID=A0A388KFQ1_CHABU|nr:hypothetical protein CBR_g3521 [Chara braunii]|eukprot:GBG68827.1 hypothetical protein CBR_g3521 [Chara braunii]
MNLVGCSKKQSPTRQHEVAAASWVPLYYLPSLAASQSASSCHGGQEEIMSHKLGGAPSIMPPKTGAFIAQAAKGCHG